MPKLKNRIIRFLIIIAAIISVMILVAETGIRIVAAHSKVKTDAKSIFAQVEQIFADSGKDGAPAFEQGSLADNSYVLSLLRTGIGGSLYAVDVHSGIITGTTNPSNMGKFFADVGLPASEPDDQLHATHAEIDGVRCYCVLIELNGIRFIYIVPRTEVYNGILQELAAMAAALAIIAVILVLSVTWYINRHVIRNIRRLNSSLEEITAGNLNANVSITGTAEFSQLSSHIQDMINSLLSTTDVMSYILNKSDMRIGVYVYNVHMKYVRFTDYIPDLLNIDPDDMNRISADYQQFKEYIRLLRSNPVGGEKNIYRIVTDSRQKFLRIDEAMHQHDVLGVVVDMTEEIEKRRRIESERDMDLLTGLMNRRGIKLELNRLFRNPEELGYGAIFMIDADDLKMINDHYGHSYGDRYLKALADVLGHFGSRKNIAARLGGDEFVVFLYGYEREKDLKQDITAFIRLQDMIPTSLDDNEDILIRFSMGYALTYGEKDHSAMLKLADDRMYENKRIRKGGRERGEE